MKHWTVQKRSILDIVNDKGIYYPDFELSNYLNKVESLKPLYEYTLNSFNAQNNSGYKGLVFSFLTQDNDNIKQYQNIEEFSTSMKNKKEVINHLWNTLLENDCIILELEYEENINPLLIDINDFQFLMPPIHYIPPYQESDVNSLLLNIKNGVFSSSIFPSEIIQGHLPYIKKENIINVHEIFTLD